jgi:hypothetical protein
MSKFLAPLNHLTDEQRRKRMLSNGERMSFDVMLADSAPISSTARNLTDSAPSGHGQANRDAIASLTGRSPIAGRNVTAVTAQIQRDAQQRASINDAVVTTTVAMESARRSSGTPIADQRKIEAGKATVDALRAARYR